MAEQNEATKDKILASAKKEFLDKGFMNASLRTIASNAGLTTGALYRNFKDKDALFCALVDDAIETAQKTIYQTNLDFHIKSDVSPVSKEHLEEEEKITRGFIDYFFEHMDAFTLLLTKSAGSSHENFFAETADIYTDSCQKILDWLKKEFHSTKEIDRMSIHVLATTMINSFAEIINHKMTKEEAILFITNMQNFFHFGFMHMLGLPHDCFK